MAAHESPRTTALFDRRDDEVAVDEVERILIGVFGDIRILQREIPGLRRDIRSSLCRPARECKSGVRGEDTIRALKHAKGPKRVNFAVGCRRL